MFKVISWSSDSHLNLASKKKIKQFCNDLKQKNSDLILLTGDISEYPYIEEHLKLMKDLSEKKIAFIYGNHDVYHSSINQLNDKLNKLTDKEKDIIWLTKQGIIELNNKTCLIGTENFWDGYYGDETKNSSLLQELVMVQDYTLIEDLNIKRHKRRDKLEKFAEETIKYLERILKDAFEKYDTIYLATHVPPFKENCLHEQQVLGDNWLYHFCNKRLGTFLSDVMEKYVNKELICLSGHVHCSSFYKPLNNLTSITAAASYFKPSIYSTLRF